MYQKYIRNCGQNIFVANTKENIKGLTALNKPQNINPIQDGPFQGCSQMGRKGSVTHNLQWWNLAVIPYLKKTQKYINHVIHSLSSADISIFSLEMSNFCYIKKRYRLRFNTQILLLWVLKGCFNKKGCNFDDARKTGSYRPS